MHSFQTHARLSFFPCAVYARLLVSKSKNVSEKFSQLEIHTTLSAEGVVLVGNLLYSLIVYY